MPSFGNIASGYRSLFLEKPVEEELKQELGAYLEMAAEEKMKRGMSRKDALRADSLFEFRRHSRIPAAGLPCASRNSSPWRVGGFTIRRETVTFSR